MSSSVDSTCPFYPYLGSRLHLLRFALNNSSGYSKSNVPKYCNATNVHPSTIKENRSRHGVDYGIDSSRIDYHFAHKSTRIKMIRKNLKITQSCFINCVPSVPGIPHDTPKLFLGGYVRKDIQYSEAVRQTVTAVEGVIKDFVVDIPVSCVVDLGKHLIFPPVHYDQQRECGFASGDLTEYNVVSQNYYNSLPTCQLLFSQINEMDNALDRLPLHGGPLAEGVFKTLQEKMVILIQLRLTFPTQIDHPDKHCKHGKDHKHKHDKDCKHRNTKKD